MHCAESACHRESPSRAGRPRTCITGLLAAAWLLSVLLARPALSQEQVLRLRLVTTTASEDNLFRVRDDVTDPQSARGLNGRSDYVSTAALGLLFDKSYALQRFQFDVTQTATRHKKFTFLDRNAFNYRGAWRWNLTPRVSGVLSTDRAESIVGFEDSQTRGNSITVTTSRSLTIDGWLFGGWHVLAGASEQERKNSSAFESLPSTVQTGGEVGLRYESAARSSITATTRRREGVNSGQEIDRVNFIDSGFRIRENELAATWLTTGRSTLNGRLTRIEQRHAHIPQRDFSGVGGEFGIAWTPTGKLTVGLSMLRALSAFVQGTTSSYRLEDTLAFTPAWRLSERTTVRMRASRQVTEYLGPVFAAAGPSRRDVLSSLLLSAEWQVHPKLALSATLRRDQRTSTDPAVAFGASATTVNASLSF